VLLRITLASARCSLSYLLLLVACLFVCLLACVCVRSAACPRKWCRVQVLDTALDMSAADSLFFQRCAGASVDHGQAVVVVAGSANESGSNNCSSSTSSNNSSSSTATRSQFSHAHALHYAAEACLAQGRTARATELLAELCDGLSQHLQLLLLLPPTTADDAAPCPSCPPAVAEQLRGLYVLSMRRRALAMLRWVGGWMGWWAGG
jgi:hypothetical protein